MKIRWVYIVRKWNSIKRNVYSLRLRKYMPKRITTSESDNYQYPAFCLYASENDNAFSTFRKNPIYTQILENVPEYIGEQCLWYIHMNSRVSFNPAKLAEFLKNDIIGKPVCYDYSYYFNNYFHIDGVVECSPATIRYVKVLQDILDWFDMNNVDRIAEIGIGYGGQCRIVISSLKKLKEYTLYDLPEVLKLSERYLSTFGLNVRLNYVDATANFEKTSPDLVLSNFAFSELDRDVQEIYLEKVILNAKRGMITYNQLSHINRNGYSVQELLNVIPGSKIVEEKPLSCINNCIIAWGMHYYTGWE